MGIEAQKCIILGSLLTLGERDLNWKLQEAVEFVTSNDLLEAYKLPPVDGLDDDFLRAYHSELLIAVTQRKRFRRIAMGNPVGGELPLSALSEFIRDWPCILPLQDEEDLHMDISTGNTISDQQTGVQGIDLLHFIRLSGFPCFLFIKSDTP